MILHWIEFYMFIVILRKCMLFFLFHSRNTNDKCCSRDRGEESAFFILNHPLSEKLEMEVVVHPHF